MRERPKIDLGLTGYDEMFIHNHFVLNTVSFVDGIKYHRTKEDYQAMRDASDRLCREYGLSVVKHPEGRGKNYGEWRAEQNGKPTYRDRIKRDIDTAISMSLTDTEFFRNLKDMGYEIKWDGKHKELQRPSLKPKGAKKYFRFDRLGEDYSLDEIYNRILENIRRKVPFPEETQEEVRKYRRDHPPKVDLGGLTKLYYYYCYELHIIFRYPTSVSRVSHFMREDLMKNGSMFADLCNYTDKNFYEEHKTIQFDTLSSLGQYEVVAVFKFNTNKEDFRYNECCTMNEKAFKDFMSQVNARQLYDTGVDAEYGDQLLTLSTCEYSLYFNDLQNRGVSDEISVAEVVGLFSGLANRAVMPSLVICGRVVMSGSMMPITTELDEIFVTAANAGAKRIMLPSESKEKYDKLRSDLKNEISVIFYATPLDAAKKALGVD